MTDPAETGDRDGPLRAMFLNCTLKRSPDRSHTDGLIEASRRIMASEGVEVSALRPVDCALATGVAPDMTESGWETDEWPDLYRRVLEQDIVVVCTPIWLGEMSSECVRLIERMYANSGDTNGRGQFVYYGRVGGCLVTGNEDGAKHCARGVLYALQHLGFMIPPQADAAWVGEAGPGKSYRDDGSPGPDNDFTNRNVTIMTWNLIHAARMLRRAGGWPARGNDTNAWKNGERFGHPGAGAIRALKGGPSQRSP
jgi:multimeric flavodoxin WrbA